MASCTTQKKIFADAERKKLDGIYTHMCDQLKKKQNERIKAIRIFFGIVLIDGIAFKATMALWRNLYVGLSSISGIIAAFCTLWIALSIVLGDCREAFFGPEIYVARCNHWLRAYGVQFDPKTPDLLLDSSYR
mmetsp:Transcript_2461/g.3602  ORF Transcript_2461/g.3602 Transcript_2461/m.3602 type:complete len:133 (-) Transcript_2461:23-421(-)